VVIAPAVSAIAVSAASSSRGAQLATSIAIAAQVVSLSIRAMVSSGLRERTFDGKLRAGA
jgi:hypothetical protein